MPGTLDFSVVIVTWNVKTLLQDCLESIFRLPEGERPATVFVVDNASSDGTVRMVREQFPHVQCVANAENRGFAAANNQALARIPTGHVVLLNPDTVVHPGVFAQLLDAFSRHPRAGIAGPTLLNPDGTHQQSVRRLPTPTALVAVALKMRYWWPSFPPLRAYLARDLQVSVEQRVGQVMGAAFAIRRELLDTVGTLDEGFRLWFEEVDYCKRAADAGWETWFIPSAKVTHVGGQSFAQQPSVAKQQQWHASALRYSTKHFSRAGATCVKLAGIFGIGIVRVLRFVHPRAV